MPTLPGQGPTPSIFDTATGTLVQAPSGGIYVCGITPYDATHLGHASTYVAYDTLLRVWKDSGADAVYVQNITDIDDPLLERAEETGVHWQDLAESQVDLFRSDMEALSVIPPTHYVGVVESMDLIIEGVREMLEEGAAYWVGDDLYADLSVDPGFGSIGHLDAGVQRELFAERGGDPDTPGKRHELDPLVWRAKRGDDPAWDGGPLGWGRPGWHIECAVIARKYLKMPFIVQGGGSDLVFPHHEMSLSHLRVLTGVGRPADVNMHSALIEYEGEKMSKSLGNLIFVSKLRAQGVEPDAIRLLLLGQHYRIEWEYTDALLEAAITRLDSWRAAVRDGNRDEGADAEQVLAQVRQALADDLDTLGALEAIDAWAASGRQSRADRELIAQIADGLLGVKDLGVVAASA